MSHIIEVYAKELGVKIGRPYITEHFCPLPCDKYITIHNSKKMQTKDYDYWDVVISLVKKALSKESIKIIQIGGKEDVAIGGIDFNLIGNPYKHMNYIIKNSLLHVGVDSLPVHVASAYDKPIVALYGNTFKDTCKPIWNKDSKVICLEPDFSEKLPSFSTSEPQKRINEIYPEVIAQSILDQLNIDAKINFKTKKIGKNFHSAIIEVIPNFFGIVKELQNQVVSLRADLHFDEENIYKWSVTNELMLYLKQPISDRLLGAIKKKTRRLVFEIDSLDEDHSKFLKKIKRNNIDVKLFTRNKEVVDDARFIYFDFDLFLLENDTDDLEGEDLKYLSKKIVLTNGQNYKSKFSAKTLDKSSKFILNEDSIEELESFYIYE